MVALPQTTNPTVAAIDEQFRSAQDASHYRYIRGSGIGHPCSRHLWYKWRWAHKPEEFSGRMLRLFETGHREESRMITQLRNVGVDVQDVDPSTKRQWQVTALDGHFRGHADGILTGIIEAPSTPHLFEAKTHGEKSFSQLVKHGVDIAKPEHVAQMQIYMHLLGLTRGFYLAKNKNTDELYAERLRYDPAHAAALMVKAERIKESHDPLERISDDPDYFLCKAFKCASYDLCHGNGWALRNCRTCIHSSPVGHGGWHCDRDDRPLSYKEQNAGCAAHRYLPGLVPGEQIDADEAAETITYQIHSGGEFIDGAMS